MSTDAGRETEPEGTGLGRTSESSEDRGQRGKQIYLKPPRRRREDQLNQHSRPGHVLLMEGMERRTDGRTGQIVRGGEGKWVKGVENTWWTEGQITDNASQQHLSCNMVFGSNHRLYIKMDDSSKLPPVRAKHEAKQSRILETYTYSFNSYP